MYPTDVLTIRNTLSVTFEEEFNRILKFGATVYAINECQRHLFKTGDDNSGQWSVVSLRRAVVEGDVMTGSVMAGQIAGMIKKEQTCQEIIEEMMAQAEKLLGRN